MTRKPDTRQPWEKARDQALAIQELIEDDVPDHAKDRAGDFFDDIYDKAKSMAERIEHTTSVSEKQQAALDGWEAGVRKWIRD